MKYIASSKLENVETRASDNPETFLIPSRQQRERVRKGDQVKLCFKPGERMWVEITHVKDARYTGILRSRPAVTQANPGDVVVFGPEHIAMIEKARG